MQVNSLLMLVSAVKSQLPPRASPGAFCTKARRCRFYRACKHRLFLLLLCFREVSTYCKTARKNRMQQENCLSQAEPFSVQQLRSFRGTARLGSNRSPCTQQKMMLIKETLNLASRGFPRGPARAALHSG